jgi:hypothetical protein
MAYLSPDDFMPMPGKELKKKSKAIPITGHGGL